MDREDWEQLRALYPSWRIRPTASERAFIATRLDRRFLTRDELVAGLSMTLLEDTPARLLSALAGQTEIEETP